MNVFADRIPRNILRSLRQSCGQTIYLSFKNKEISTLKTNI